MGEETVPELSLAEQSQQAGHYRSLTTEHVSSDYMSNPAMGGDEIRGGMPTSASMYMDPSGSSQLQGFYHSPAPSQQQFSGQMDNYPSNFMYSQQYPYSTLDGSTSTYLPSTSMLSASSMMSDMSSPTLPHSVNSHLQGPSAGNHMVARGKHGDPVDVHAAYYQQQFPATHAGPYANQGSYYPPSTSASIPHGLYPSMMGGVPSTQYSAIPYGAQQHQQYTMSAYNAHSQQLYNPQVQLYGQSQAWTSPAQHDYSQIQQQPWVQQQKYIPYQRQHHTQSSNPSFRHSPQTPSTPSPSGRVSSTRSSSGRSNTLMNSSLPARPGVGLAPHGRPAQVDLHTASTSDSSRPMPAQQEQDARIPGKGLRQHYHPQQGPRSDFVLWCGNVPSDATVEELWSFFSTLPPLKAGTGNVPSNQSNQIQEYTQEAEELQGDPAMSPTSGHGVLSVFIIARSNCAFVNYATPEHLQRAVAYFHGQTLRPQDQRCPKLVCRVRKKDDEAQAGVAGQRGRGIHVAWVKEQDRKSKELARSRSKASEEGAQRKEPFVEGEGVAHPSVKQAIDESGIEASKIPLELSSSDPSADSALAISEQSIDVAQAASGDGGIGKRPSISAGDGSSGSISYTSTNSSLLRHPAFHERFFILKSLRQDDLDRSVQMGLWATQPHNEQVLDQAYRNSEFVYLIFSANESGGFYGYARMTGPILSSEEKQQHQISRVKPKDAASQLSSSSADPRRSETIRPEVVEETTEELADSTAAIDTPETDLGQTKSPMQLTPAGEIESPMADLTSSENLSWPTQKKSARIELDRDSKPQTQSLSYDAAPKSAVATMNSPDEASALRGKTTMMKNASSSSLLQTPLSESGSLGPSDSASLDSRAQQHLALRALIHNLRLEERESMMRAEQLERDISGALPQQQGTGLPMSSNVDSTETNTPRAGSSDSFGKPFKIEWIKCSPLPFQQVKKLRNPWRDNRQIKVSRDGTELEPNVGRQLLKEWSQAEGTAKGSFVQSKAESRETELEEEVEG